jgi:hypothetical protein
MKWVTWENVGVDRTACAWLIMRCIDARATFVFVPRGSMELPAGATPFDIPGVKLSHHRGHCSFHMMLKAYKLADPVLQRIARIIDEADTLQEAPLEPIAAGLDAICRGLRRTSKDDQTAIKRCKLIYDALYAELSAKVGQS